MTPEQRAALELLVERLDTNAISVHDACGSEEIGEIWRAFETLRAMLDWEKKTITFGGPITEACAGCGTLVHPRYPKHSRCAQCGSSEPTVPVSGVGSVP